eukprot:6985388-Alexandrium_andersonii.AAC.1
MPCDGLPGLGDPDERAAAAPRFAQSSAPRWFRGARGTDAQPLFRTERCARVATRAEVWAARPGQPRAGRLARSGQRLSQN